MTRPVLLTAVSAALLAGGCGKFKDLLDPPMAEFTSPDGKWKAKFPGAPREQSKSALNLTFTIFLREPFGGKGGYAVGFGDLPVPAAEADPQVQKRLDDAVAGSVGGVNGKLRDSKRIFLHGRYPGREFSATITEPKAGLYHVRMYVVGSRIYQVAVMGVDEFVNTPQSEEFLNSFELTGETAPAHVPGGISNPLERFATKPKPRAAAEAAVPPAAPAAPGVSIHSDGGKYKARFPADPKKGTAAAGDVTYATYSATADGASYAAGYADLTDLDGATGKQRQAALDAARDDAVADLGAGSKMAKCELLVLAGRHRGWEFSAEAGDRSLRARVYLVGTRLYRVTVRGSAGAIRGGSADAFLESFQVVN